MQQLILLGGDRVAEVTRILHRDLLVPALGPCPLLTLEGVETRDRDIKIGQCERDGRVAHVLVQVGSGAERHANA